ncbi:recombinase family protein [Altererythrobacter sp. N1]|nr:recombinase family protein [Altererythrobacter sp. N1]
MARIGYARVSTEEQNLDLQLFALTNAGCDRVFSDHGVSALAKRRRGFDQALKALQSGDTFVIWKMDRAFRSLRHALEVFDHFEAAGIEFHVLTEGIDTATPMGKCFYQIRNAFAELERNLISERTKAGLQEARRRGTRLGRPRALSRSQIADARRRHSRGEPMAKIAARSGVSERTMYRAMLAARSAAPATKHFRESAANR